jgi:hypothetical protein
LTAWTLSLLEDEFAHQYVVDASAAQNADAETKAITIAFALIGLYLHIEKGFNGRQVQRAHMRLAQPRGRGAGRKDWPRFELPHEHATMSAADVIAVPESERIAAIERWCRSVWESWSASHSRVRAWAAAEGWA